MKEDLQFTLLHTRHEALCLFGKVLRLGQTKVPPMDSNPQSFSKTYREGGKQHLSYYMKLSSFPTNPCYTACCGDA
jgi:hypothetical protein